MTRLFRVIGIGAAVFLAALVFGGCEQQGGGGYSRITWTATANGAADEELSTVITFSFSEVVPDLRAEHISIAPGTGLASAVEILGTGQSASLLIDVEKAGTVRVSIDKADVEPGPRSVTVYMGYEIPPPEKTGITILSPPDITLYAKNQTFDRTGLVVVWVYSDESVEPIPAGGYQVTEPDMGKAATQRVTVQAGSYTSNFWIQVLNSDKVLSFITVSGPTNKIQELGKAFNSTGLAVTGHYSDDSTSSLTSLAHITGYDKNKRGPQVVTVKINGKTASIEGITTRIGEEAIVRFYTGYGAKTTFIKGETLTPAKKANIMFQHSHSGVFLAADTRTLSLANGGLTLADFDTLTGYNPQKTGRQTLSMTLDGRPFEVSFYVVDAEPAVWFDFGYMRHDGDPTGAGKGAGIDAGKYYARPGETLVIAPVRYLIGYNDDNSDAGVTCNWTVSGGAPDTTIKDGELLHITPQTAGTYTVSVNVTGRNYITGDSITKTAVADVVCYSGPVSDGGKTFSSPLKNFGAGQMCESGTGYGWSLGSAGGYEVWQVEHRASYNIPGNPLASWLEPGVVWMQEDNNANGLPDEMWYELPGSDETSPVRKNLITRRYAVTYFKTDDHGSTNEYGQLIREVYWADSRGRAGMIPGGFPTPWGVTGNRVTYTCTLLRDDGIIFADSYNMDGLAGYVDTTDATFPVSRAVRVDGAPANISAVKFIKVQTGMFRYGGLFGDVSTEIPYADFLPDQRGGFPMP